MALTVGVLDFTTRTDTRARRVTAGEQIRNWLVPALPDAAVRVIDIAGGAELPAPDAFDGFVLGGSEKGVYDPAPWMAPLRSFLLTARDIQRPLVGICFGHQIMADTFGGRAHNAGLGMIVGVRDFDIDGGRQSAHVWHQDQVLAVPPGARVSAQAAYCPVGALEYDFPAWSVQFHPEYTAGYMSGEVSLAAGTSLDPAVAGQALRSIAAANVPADLVADRAARTLRRG